MARNRAGNKKLTGRPTPLAASGELYNMQRELYDIGQGSADRQFQYGETLLDAGYKLDDRGLPIKGKDNQLLLSRNPKDAFRGMQAINTNARNTTFGQTGGFHGAGTRYAGAADRANLGYDVRQAGRAFDYGNMSDLLRARTIAPESYRRAKNWGYENNAYSTGPAWLAKKMRGRTAF